jgi:hypothetical protein
MPSQFKKGHVIFRHWDSKDGLNEVARSFSTLDELLNLCLQTESNLLVDRVILDGEDGEQGGQGGQSVTLRFQSASLRTDPQH